jgi:hypothetical protein
MRQICEFCTRVIRRPLLTPPATYHYKNTDCVEIIGIFIKTLTGQDCKSISVRDFPRFARQFIR